MEELEKYVDKHYYAYPLAYEELSAGRKRSHWMWYMFPQIKGLGYSIMCQKYALNNLDEAKAFLNHPVLGSHLKTLSNLLLKNCSDDAEWILGFPDCLKLRSSMTLFIEADPNEQVFQKVLDKFYNGEKDEKTLEILNNLRKGGING